MSTSNYCNWCESTICLYCPVYLEVTFSLVVVCVNRRVRRCCGPGGLTVHNDSPRFLLCTYFPPITWSLSPATLSKTRGTITWTLTLHFISINHKITDTMYSSITFPDVTSFIIIDDLLCCYFKGRKLESFGWIWKLETWSGVFLFLWIVLINELFIFVTRTLNILLDSKSPPPPGKTPDCSFKSLVTARDPLDSLSWALEKELPDPHAAEVWARCQLCQCKRSSVPHP